MGSANTGYELSPRRMGTLRRPAARAQGDAPLITVAGNPQTAAWLSSIAWRAGRSWRVGELGRSGSRGVLVLPEMEEYPALLRHWTGIERAVVGLDCPEGRSLALSDRVETFTFSEGRDTADLTAKDLRLTCDGLRFVAVTKDDLAWVCVEPEQLYPALAALACGVWLGAGLEEAAQAVSVSVPAAEARGKGKIVKMA